MPRVVETRKANPALTAEKIRAIRRKYDAGESSQQNLAREYKISQALVGQIVNNKLSEKLAKLVRDDDSEYWKSRMAPGEE